MNSKAKNSNKKENKDKLEQNHSVVSESNLELESKYFREYSVSI